LGPPQHDRACPKVQGARRCPRRRRCLLKGCEQLFQPSHPQARYCSEACRRAARRWRAWRARRRYRATEQGKACRRDQSRRYRARCRSQREGRGDGTGPAGAEDDCAGELSCHVAVPVGGQEDLSADPAPPSGREGERPADFSKKSSCDRPGCYTCFEAHPRSPLQRFCSSLCRRALQRVREREARWRRGSLRRPPKCRSG
jgi:hypothetical protein